MVSERHQPEVVRLRLRAPDARCAEIAAAEAFEAGASGLVEEEDGLGLIIYAPGTAAGDLERALRNAGLGLELGELEPVEPVAWAEAWKQVLGPVEISSRLLVASPHAECTPAEGQRCLWIEPGQAFGTGAHDSTRLALECIDALYCERAPGRVLDVGTGSGVLALAALALGADAAVAFDLDPLAAPAARVASRANALEDRLELFTGPIDALAPARFGLVVANLLRSELLPIAGSVAQRVAGGGALVLAGLLEGDVARVLATFEPLGLCETARRLRRDGDDEGWVGLILCR